ncbi:PREDICTED: septin-1-like, partial [Amphimedon queenslandica]
MKELHNLVNIIPVIAKSDTLTQTEVRTLKTRILQEISDNGIRIYNGEIDEEDDSPEIRELRDAIPMAVVGSTTLLEVGNKRVRGRLYPWGVVESKINYYWAKPTSSSRVCLSVHVRHPY